MPSLTPRRRAVLIALCPTLFSAGGRLQRVLDARSRTIGYRFETLSFTPRVIEGMIDIGWLTVDRRHGFVTIAPAGILAIQDGAS